MFSTALNHLSPPLSPSLSLSLSLSAIALTPLRFRPSRLDPRLDTIRDRGIPFHSVLSRKSRGSRFHQRRGADRGRCQPPGPAVGILRWPLPFGSPSASPDTFVYALDIHGCAHAVNMPAYMRERTGSSSRSVAARYVRSSERPIKKTNIYIYVYIRTTRWLVEMVECVTQGGRGSIEKEIAARGTVGGRVSGRIY